MYYILKINGEEGKKYTQNKEIAERWIKLLNSMYHKSHHEIIALSEKPKLSKPMSSTNYA
jgi:hypothetical protein